MQRLIMGYLPSLSSLLRIVGGVLIVSLASTVGLLYRYQTSLIYPSSFPSGSKLQVSTPDEYDLPFTEHIIETPDGQKLRVYVMLQGTRLAQATKVQSSAQKPAKVHLEYPDKSLAASRPTILFFHANAGNMGHRLPLAAVFFKRFGCNVIMLSYRGYGFSTGQPNERGIRIDAQSTLDWIRQHEILSKTLVVAFGQSIGGAVAIDLASRNPKTIFALILENTFLSIPELIPHVLPLIRPLAFICREFWPSGTSITQISSSMPVLFLSGRQDELVPPLHMDTLFQRCSSKIKLWKEFPEGTHNDTCVKPKYFESVAEFLKSHVIPSLSVPSSHVPASLDADAEIDNEKATFKPATATLPTDEARSTSAPSATATASASQSGSEDADDWIQMTESEIMDASKASTLSVAPQEVIQQASKEEL